MTSAPRRTLNEAVTRFWSFAAPLYDLRVLQQWVYRPAQDEVILVLSHHGARRIADIACGTGILADRIAKELRPDEVYGVDMSEGMLAQARARASNVHWRKAAAEQLPFDDGLWTPSSPPRRITSSTNRSRCASFTAYSRRAVSWPWRR